jgi:hypothetical protein
MSYGRNYRKPTQAARTTTGRTALVTPRQMSALGKMAAEHGFTSGSALLCDVASCDVAELGRKSRPVVQMFVDQAFERYGRNAQPRASRGRCEDAPCCGCCE